jgi:hypothetical protein
MKRRPARTSLSKRGGSIQDPAAAVTVAAGQNWLAPATANPPWRTITMPRLLPHTIQLCVHCRQHPAGFWVSHTSDQTVRRPWCLSCCQDLDPGHCHLSPFDS